MEHPKTRKQIEADPRVESIHREYDSSDGYASWWLYLKPGFICPAMECGTIHERTIKKVCALLQTVTKTEGE